jgi:hypothetical protein
MLCAVLVSCHSATEKWLSNLADYRELHAKSMVLKIMKVTSGTSDTTTLNYKVRVFPARQWLETRTPEQKTGLFYDMDSCFAIQTMKASVTASFVQPVNSGVANCFEYLVSFPVDHSIRQKELSLVYRDKYIDQKQHKIDLSR